MILNNYLPYIIASGILVPVLIMLLIIITSKKKKSTNKVVDFNHYEKIYEALGKTNITTVEKQQDRIRILLTDVKMVDAKKLNELKIPAFLKGNEIKLLFKDNSDELVKYLKDKLKA